MARKRKQITEEKIKAAEKLRELQELEEQSIAEEQKIMEDARAQIEDICNKADLFCGVIFMPADLGNIVAAAAASPGKQTHIPFNLYFKE